MLRRQINSSAEASAGGDAPAYFPSPGNFVSASTLFEKPKRTVFTNLKDMAPPMWNVCSQSPPSLAPSPSVTAAASACPNVAAEHVPDTTAQLPYASVVSHHVAGDIPEGVPIGDHVGGSSSAGAADNVDLSIVPAAIEAPPLSWAPPPTG